MFDWLAAGLTDYVRGRRPERGASLVIPGGPRSDRGVRCSATVGNDIVTPAARPPAQVGEALRGVGNARPTSPPPLRPRASPARRARPCRIAARRSGVNSGCGTTTAPPDDGERRRVRRLILVERVRERHQDEARPMTASSRDGRSAGAADDEMGRGDPRRQVGEELGDLDRKADPRAGRSDARESSPRACWVRRIHCRSSGARSASAAGTTSAMTRAPCEPPVTSTLRRRPTTRDRGSRPQR